MTSKKLLFKMLKQAKSEYEMLYILNDLFTARALKDALIKIDDYKVVALLEPTKHETVYRQSVKIGKKHSFGWYSKSNYFKPFFQKLLSK